MRQTSARPDTGLFARYYSLQILRRLICSLFLVAFCNSFVHAEAPVPLTGKVQATFSGYVFNRVSNTFDTRATVTNKSTDTIFAPAKLAIRSFGNGAVSLANSAGKTSDGKPYVVLPIPAGGLPPGGRISNVALKFKNLGRASITFTHEISGVMSPILRVSILSPEQQTSLATDSAVVSGAFQGPASSGVTVNGVAAGIEGDKFTAVGVPLLSGLNTLTATLTTMDGKTASTEVIVNNVTPMVSLRAEPSRGVGPLKVTFQVVNRTGAMPQNISIDYNGDGLIDQQSTDSSATFETTYATAGIQSATVRVLSQNGAELTQTTSVFVQKMEQIDQLLKTNWEGMNSALLAGNLAQGAQFLTLNARTKFVDHFESLGGRLQYIVGTFSAPQPVDITSEIGEYAVTRVVDGELRAFLIYFLQDTDGVWRIDEM